MFVEFGDRAKRVLASRWSRLTLLIILLMASVSIRLPGLFSRAIWEDESITLLETAGHMLPAWPAKPAPASLAKSQFQGASSLKQIIADLGSKDSHPPLYYWSVFLWQRCWGSSINATRALSLVYSVAAILALYGLLCVAKFESPFIATLFYAFSTGSVHFGQEARSYALVTLLTTSAALCAYMATESSTQNRWRFGAYSMATGLFCGAAFATHYFALFPVCVILAWFLANLRSGFRLIAVATLLLGCSVASLGLLTLLSQLKERSMGSRVSGYRGLLREAVAIGQMNVNLLWKPSVSLFTGTPARLARGLMYGGWVVLLGSSVLLLFRHSLEGRRRFWLLVLGLAVAPSAGLMLLDFLWNKHLLIDRYLAWAGPALAVIAGYGVAKLLSYRSKPGWCLVAGVLLIQFTGINWGTEKDGNTGSYVRSLAKTIQDSPASSRVVVISEEKQRCYPAPLIYELDPGVVIVTLGTHQDLDQLCGLIKKYEYIWFVHCEHETIVAIEREFFSRLLRSGLHKQVSSYPDYQAVLLRRLGIARK